MKRIDIKNVKADDDHQVIDIEYVVSENRQYDPEIIRTSFTYTTLSQRLFNYDAPVVVTIGGKDRLWVPKEGIVEY